jgi:glycosyltransferase involved in cell wall biosynthesis
MEVVFLDAITDSQKPGASGLSDVIWRLAYELTKLGVEASVVGFYLQDAPPPHPNINFIRINPPDFRSQNIFTNLYQRAFLVKNAKQYLRADTVIHVSDILSAGFVSLMGSGHKSVWQGHSNVLHNSRLGNPWDSSTYLALRLFSSLAARSIRYVIALGPSLVYWWKLSGFRSNSIRIIPNAIDLNENFETTKSIELPQGWTAKPHKILYVGRLARDKGGYFELLNCLQDLNRNQTSATLLFVGDGPMRSEVEYYSQRFNHPNTVFFLGNQPPKIVRAVYPKSDLLILPSKNEMMPRVMLEAWVYGTAFMGTDVGAVGDYLVDGQNGYLLRGLEHDYFVKRVQDALEDDQQRERIIKNGRKIVMKYSWPIVARKYAQLYQAVLESDNGDYAE